MIRASASAAPVHYGDLSAGRPFELSPAESDSLTPVENFVGRAGTILWNVIRQQLSNRSVPFRNLAVLASSRSFRYNGPVVDHRGSGSGNLSYGLGTT